MTDLPTALLRFTEVLLLSCVAWTTLVVALARGRRTARLAVALTPRLFRAALLTGVSGALTLAPPAQADDLDGLPLPDRQATIATTSPPDHVVRPGESLWAIAVQAEGHGATVADVATATNRWYEANRRTIGPDPDLIRPGQALTAPADER